MERLTLIRIFFGLTVLGWIFALATIGILLIQRLRKFPRNHAYLILRNSVIGALPGIALWVAMEAFLSKRPTDPLDVVQLAAAMGVSTGGWVGLATTAWLARRRVPASV